MMCLHFFYLVLKSKRPLLENKGDVRDSDMNVSGYEIQVNYYLNVYTGVSLYVGVSMHSNKHAVLWMCNHWENSAAAFTSACEAPDLLQIWKALHHSISNI